MSAYFIVDLDIRDHVGFQAYARAVGPVLEKFGARYLVSGEAGKPSRCWRATGGLKGLPSSSSQAGRGRRSSSALRSFERSWDSGTSQRRRT